MTKLITNISKDYFYENDEFENELLCLVSDDRFELIEMISTQIKKMNRGDSFLVNWVKEKTDEDDDSLKVNFIKKGDTYFDTYLGGYGDDNETNEWLSDRDDVTKGENDNE